MGAMRRCSKTGCPGEARATLTYNYADSTVVIGPLARRAEPHTYDLCEDHARRTTAPRGWEVLRLELPEHYVTADGQTAAPARTPGPRLTPPAPVAEAPVAPHADTAPQAPADPARPGLRIVRDTDGR